ncbi:MAG: hypothetical protein M1820_003426 [Bogoriella megaspora]|nr:MAG: hypothetical protein M1820_003426 [Bogoriella megaspora]
MAPGRNRYPFRGLKIAYTGDFGKKDNERMKSWIKNAGGTPCTEIDENTTHLIASRAHWKERIGLVGKAKRMKTVKIVEDNWLYFSLQYGKRQNEGEYAWDKNERQNAKTQHRQKEEQIERDRAMQKTIEDQVGHAVTEQFLKGCRAAKQDLQSAIGKLTWLTTDNHHIYADATGFEYDVTMARLDPKTNKNERYRLKLYEDNTTPSCYAVHVKFFRHPKPTGEQILASVGSSFTTAFSAFQKFFKSKTKLNWSERLDSPDTLMPSQGKQKSGPIKETEPEKNEDDEDDDTDNAELEHIYGALAVWVPKRGHASKKVPTQEEWDRKEEDRIAKERLDKFKDAFRYIKPKAGQPIGVFPDTSIRALPIGDESGKGPKTIDPNPEAKMEVDGNGKEKVVIVIDD